MKKQTILFVFLVLAAFNASAQEIQVVSIEAKLEQKNLTVEIIVHNKGTSTSELKMLTNYFSQTDSRTENIPPETTKKMTYTIYNAKPGNVKIALENGTQKYIAITVPEDTEQNRELSVREITSEEYQIVEEEKKNGIDYYQAALFIAGGIIILIIAMTAIRKMKGKKTEEQLEMNAELLKEADEAKRKGKIKKIEA